MKAIAFVIILLQGQMHVTIKGRVGSPTRIGHPAPVIGLVIPGSPADDKRLMPGDRVLSVNGAKVEAWDEIPMFVQQTEGRDLILAWKRGDHTLQTELTPRRALDDAGRLVWDVGIRHERLGNRVGVIPESKAAAAGIKSWSRVVAVNERDTPSWLDIVEATSSLTGRELSLVVVQSEFLTIGAIELAVPVIVRAVVLLPAGSRDDRLARVGIEPIDLQVFGVEPGSAAERHGIRPLDKITSVDGATTGSWDGLGHLLNASAHQEVKLGIRRGEHSLSIQLQPDVVPVPGFDGQQHQRRALGVRYLQNRAPGVFEDSKVRQRATSSGPSSSAVIMTLFWTSWIALRRPFLGPAESYREFCRLVREDYPRALQFLSRQALAAFRSTGQMLKALQNTQDDALLVFWRSARKRKSLSLNSVDVVRQDGATAMLRVVAGSCTGEPGSCTRGTVRMVREDACWVIEPELPDTLRPGE